MEEVFILIFAGLALLAWGFGLIGVPMLFRRIKRIEAELNELKQYPAGYADTSLEKSSAESAVHDDQNTTVEKPPAEESIESSHDDYEQQLAAAYSYAEQASLKSEQDDLSSTSFEIVQDEVTDTMPQAKQPSWLERQLSTNLTAKIGAIVLIFGAIFLAKYASDIGVFTVTARLWSMGLVAIAFAVVGWRLAASQRLYANILQGTAFAVWLATWFAAHILYEQVGWVFTLLATVLAVVMIGYRALNQNSQVLAFIALLGGFISPFIASSEASSLWRLFSYMLVLNIAVAIIAANKPWRWFLRLGYLGSFSLLSLLMIAEYLQQDLAQITTQLPMLIFIIGLILIYSLLATRWLSTESAVFQRALSGLTISVPSMAALAVYGLFRDQSLATASIYVGAALWFGLLWFKTRYWVLLATAIVSASIAIPFALNDSLSSLIYSIEGAAFFVFAVRQQRWVYLAWSGVIQIAAVIFAFNLFTYTSAVENQLYLAWVLFGAVCIAGLFSAWSLNQQGSFGRYNVFLQRTLIAWSLFWWLYLWGFYFSELYSRHTTILVCIGLLPATFLLAEMVSLKVKWENLRFFNAVFLLLLFFSGMLFYVDYGTNSAVGENIFVVAMLLAILVVRIKVGYKPGLLATVEGGLLWFGYIGLMSLTLSNIGNPSTDWNLTWGLTPLAVGINLIQPLIHRLFLRTNEQRWVLWLSTAGVLLFSLFTVARLGNYAPWPFIPVLHPLSLVLVFIAYPVFSICRTQRIFIVPTVVWAAILITVEANRFLFHYIGVAFEIDAWFSSAITQTVWSLLWSCLGAALMVIGSRIRLSRRVWTAGAIALALVVLKLFVLDLSNVDTLYRILSFIGVGALLLAVGYFAPLPQVSDESIEKATL